MDLGILSQLISCMFFFWAALYASLSLAKFDSIASTLVHLLPPPLSFPPSSLCHFIALSRPPF